MSFRSDHNETRDVQRDAARAHKFSDIPRARAEWLACALSESSTGSCRYFRVASWRFCRSAMVVMLKVSAHISVSASAMISYIMLNESRMICRHR